MATLHIPDENRKITGAAAIAEYLAGIGIGYKVWQPAFQLDKSASSQDILRAFAPQIDELKKEGGYVTADVIDLHPDTANLENMLARFRREHWHDEDEVRFIVEGHGVFHIHPRSGPVIALEVEPGDLARVPVGTWHWFDLCADRRIRAIRLFQDPAGWTPRYTESGVDKGYQPVCLGPAFIPPHNPHSA
jgi:1,2-dihydroxy-3-keto-5-methylthiopentene dioxygenase